MTEIREFTYPSGDGQHTIHAQEWLPQGAPRAVVQIVHGVSEYVGRYDALARFLNDRGILVCGEDHLGHGLTAKEGEYGYFAPENGWFLVVNDVRRLRKLQESKYPGVPYFLLGHSMGSFLTRTYLCRFPGELDGAILSGTGQESALNVAMGRHIGELICSWKGDHHISRLIHALTLGAYNKKFAPNRTTADWISRDTEQVDRYLADRLCTFQPTAGMWRDMMGGLQYIASPRNLARMDKNTPIYIYSGADDPVGGMGKGVKKVYGYFDAQGVKDLSLKLYPGGRHEMHNELNRDEVFADLLRWLDRHIPQ